jgi:hypothetical protein
MISGMHLVKVLIDCVEQSDGDFEAWAPIQSYVRFFSHGNSK